MTMVRLAAHAFLRFGPPHVSPTERGVKALGGLVRLPVSLAVAVAPWVRLAGVPAVAPGNGVIRGTTKEHAAPVALPLSRPVRLYREDTGEQVSITYSSSQGDYAFRGVQLGYRYFVVGFDTSDLYRAVVADKLTPEVAS